MTTHLNRVVPLDCGHEILAGNGVGLDPVAVLTCTLPFGHPTQTHRDEESAERPDLGVSPEWTCPLWCPGGRVAHVSDEVTWNTGGRLR